MHVWNHGISDSLEIAGYETYQVYVYPGQTFKVLAALYGQRNGSVPGIVRANLVNKSRVAHLAPLQETQKTGYLCGNLTYTIFSTRHSELIQLRVDSCKHYIFFETYVIIQATLFPCPPGFQLSNITAQCECAPILQDRGLLCNISGNTTGTENQVNMDQHPPQWEWHHTTWSLSTELLQTHSTLATSWPPRWTVCSRTFRHPLWRMQFKLQSDNRYFSVFGVYKYLPCSSYTICTSWTNAVVATDHL